MGASALMAGVALLFFGLAFGSNPVVKGAAGVVVPLGMVLTGAGVLMLLASRRSSGGAAVSMSAPAVRREPTLDRLAAEFPDQSAAPHQVSSPAAPRRWGLEVFDAIEWRRFEAVVERLFQQAGFVTKSQSHGADGGIDVWLYSRNQPGQPVSIVQCKHWAGRRVGVDKVRELRGVMASKNVSRGQFATTSTFTDDAIDFARANSINLLDSTRLLALIAQRTDARQAELLSVALEGE